MQKIDGRHTHIIVDNALLARVDRIAKRTGQTKSETIRRLVDLGATAFEDLEKVGIVKIAEVMVKTQKALRKEVGQQNLFEWEGA